MGPSAFAVVSQATADSRLGILSLVLFFVIGMFLLGRIDVEMGRRAARVEDESLRLVDEPE